MLFLVIWYIYRVTIFVEVLGCVKVACNMQVLHSLVVLHDDYFKWCSISKRSGHDNSTRCPGLDHPSFCRFAHIAKSGWYLIYPLSEVKNTNVFSSTPASLIASSISPTPQSNSLRASPNTPRILELVNLLPAN